MSISQLEINLIKNKDNIASELNSEWLSMKATFKRIELKTENDNAGIDVRLIVEDGCWRLHIGDAQYDTSQGDYCASEFLDYDWEEAEVEALCLSTAGDLIESIAETEAWQS